MSTTDDRPPRPRALAAPHSRSRMRAYVQILGGSVLGFGLASAGGVGAGLPFAAPPPRPRPPPATWAARRSLPSFPSGDQKG